MDIQLHTKQNLSVPILERVSYEQRISNEEWQAKMAFLRGIHTELEVAGKKEVFVPDEISSDGPNEGTSSPGGFSIKTGHGKAPLEHGFDIRRLGINHLKFQ